MDIYDFDNQHNVHYDWGGSGELPCFATRFEVASTMVSEKNIQDAIKYAKEASDTSLILFSVTERDGAAWQAWAEYAEKHPKTFQVIEGTSNHGPYKCRMYFYKRPVKKEA